MSALASSVISLKDLLKEKVAIPYYQRPYVWDAERVRLLLSDLDEFLDSKNTEKPEKYLLGSIIFHKNGENLDVVDGQQRLVSLSLILEALGLGGFFIEPNSLTKSKDNKEDNSTAIKDWFENHEGKREHFRQNLPEKIEFVCVFTNDLDNAFTFFDNTNAKGKRLESYDLIKAFHLRALENNDKLIRKCTEKFNQIIKNDNAKNDDYVKYLFEKILAPARLCLSHPNKDFAKNYTIYQYTIDEFCKEMPKNLYVKKEENFDINKLGIIQNFVGGKDFFDYIFYFSDLCKSVLENDEFYEKLNKIRGPLYYTTNMYVVALVIYLSKFPNSVNEKFMSLLIARAVFSLRCSKTKINEPTIYRGKKIYFNFLDEILNLIYFSSFEQELEYKLKQFIEKYLESEKAKCNDIKKSKWFADEKKDEDNAKKGKEKDTKKDIVEKYKDIAEQYKKYGIPLHFFQKEQNEQCSKNQNHRGFSKRGENL